MNEEITLFLEKYNEYKEFESYLESVTDLNDRARETNKEYKETAKDFKRFVKRNDFKEARKALNKLEKINDEFEKLFKKTKFDNADTLKGFVLTAHQMVNSTCILIVLPSLVLLATIGAAAGAGYLYSKKTGGEFTDTAEKIQNAGKKMAKTGEKIAVGAASVAIPTGIVSTLTKQLNKGNDLYNNGVPFEKAYNSVYQAFYDAIDKNKAELKKLDDKLYKAESKYKEKTKVAKESVDDIDSITYKKTKLALYEACSNGEITVEERDKLFEDLHSKFEPVK